MTAGARRPAVRQILTVLTLLALTGAGVLLGRAAYLRAKAALASVLIRKAWDKTARTSRPVRAWSWADTHPVARLVIPTLDFDEIVLEGASGEALAFAPARMMNGAAPGEPGNIILAGHRTSSFRPLEHVRTGDRIILEWSAGRQGRTIVRTYAVSEVAVVERTDLRHLAPTVTDALTLVTCYPFGYGARSPRRFIVRALPVGGATSPLSASASASVSVSVSVAVSVAVYVAASLSPSPAPSPRHRRSWATRRAAPATRA
jgi:sortase A